MRVWQKLSWFCHVIARVAKVLFALSFSLTSISTHSSLPPCMQASGVPGQPVPMRGPGGFPPRPNMPMQPPHGHMAPPPGGFPPGQGGPPGGFPPGGGGPPGGFPSGQVGPPGGGPMYQPQQMMYQPQPGPGMRVSTTRKFYNLQKLGTEVCVRHS